MSKYKFEIEAGAHLGGESQKRQVVVVEYDSINLSQDNARPLVHKKLQELTGKFWNVDIIYSIKRL